jgi:hypothetical protein
VDRTAAPELVGFGAAVSRSGSSSQGQAAFPKRSVALLNVAHRRYCAGNLREAVR